MQVSAFVNTSRARLTAYLKAMEDIKALQTEFNALGGIGFTDTFNFTGYDMTKAEYNAMLVAIGELIAVYEGGTVSTNATRPGALYKGKV